MRNNTLVSFFQVTKRRGLKMMNNVPLPMKSPATRTPQKAYKHVKFMPLSHVKRVVDIRDNDGMYWKKDRSTFFSHA